ncbi:hypothetical protein HHK36_017801 [Tetracentron sinense]|uniref:P-type Cu(+) transporter n=1 Tax=Tetracentron sinense TaxID=13715 RepID=A0A834Z143_TETSI|nr:hypothetical protein HHK36_017801 [Tetracentron sinense]
MGQAQRAQPFEGTRVSVSGEKQLGAVLEAGSQGHPLGKQLSLLPLMSQGEVSKWVVDNVEAMGRELGVSTEGRQVDVRCLYSRLEERKEQVRGCQLERLKGRRRGTSALEEKIRVALFIQKAALQFIDDSCTPGVLVYKPSKEVTQAGFYIDPDKLASLVSSKNLSDLRELDGVEGIARLISVSLDKGISAIQQPPLSVRQEIYGLNIYSDDSGNVPKSAISEKVLSILLQSIFQNTDSDVVKCKDGKKIILGTPTESALLNFGLLLGSDFDAERSKSRTVNVEPFNSDRKRMSVIVALGPGVFRAFCKGAPEIILKMCDTIVDSSGERVHLSKAERCNVTNIVNDFASEALRILCLAFKDMDDTANRPSIPGDGYTLIAVVGIKDPVRPGVKDAVETCLAAGITVKMVTGDNINTAKSIARECGILTDDGLAIEGQDFCSKSPQEMKELIPKIQVMARSSPSDKHTLVKQLRNIFGEVVAVTGDGTNDAPSLCESDIGLAMCIAGTEVYFFSAYPCNSSTLTSRAMLFLLHCSLSLLFLILFLALG